MTAMIRLNGEPSASAPTVAALVERLALPARGIAVAVNGAVVPRGTWGVAALRDGDTVEVIRAMQGG